MIRIALEWTFPTLAKNKNSSERTKYLTINTSACNPLLDWFFQSQNESKGHQSPALRVTLENEKQVQFFFFCFPLFCYLKYNHLKMYVTCPKIKE